MKIYIFIFLFILTGCGKSNNCYQLEQELDNFYFKFQDTIELNSFIDPINMNDEDRVIHFAYIGMQENLNRCK